MSLFKKCLLLTLLGTVISPFSLPMANASLVSPDFALATTENDRDDLPLPAIDLTAEGNADWALWGRSELPTAGSLTPDASRSGGSNISLLQNLVAAHAIVDFSQFSLSPAFSWSDGDASGEVSGIEQAAAMVSRGNGVGSGFEISVLITPDVDQVVFYGQLFQATGLLTADLDGTEMTSEVTSQNAGVLGDTGVVFALSDFSFETPTATLNLRWEMTEAFGNANNIPSIGLSAVTVSAIVVPEPGSVVVLLLSAGMVASRMVASRRVRCSRV